MHFRHKISIVCILVIVFQIAQCQPTQKQGNQEHTKTVKTVKKVQSQKVTQGKDTKKNMFSGLKVPISGYHFVTMSQVQKSFKPGTYNLVSLAEARKIIKAAGKKKQKKEKVSKDVSKDDDEDDDQVEITEENDNDDGKVEVTEDNDNDDGKVEVTEDNDKDGDKVEITEDHDNDGDKVEVTEDHNNDDGKEEDKEEKDAKEENKIKEEVDDDGVKEKGETENNYPVNSNSKKEDKENNNDEDGDFDVEEVAEGHGGAGDKEETGTGIVIEDVVENNDDHDKKEDKKDEQEGHGNGEEKKEEKKEEEKEELIVEPDGADYLDGGQAMAIMEDGGKADGAERRRKKRDFFPFKLPFMSSDNGATKSDTTVTAKSVTTTSTTPATGSKEATTVTDTKVTATAVAGSGSDKTITEVTTVQTKDSETGFIDGIEMHIVAIGKDVKTSLVVAAPYLPMVWKVSQFLIPGLSQYQMLVLTVNVAMITAEALKKYDSGESVQSIVLDAVTKAIKNSLFKRDGGNAFGNMYESMKTRFGFIPKYFSGDKTTSSVTVNIDETTKDVEKVETEVTAINGEITEAEVTVTEKKDKSVESINKSNKMTENIEKKIMKMKKEVHSSESLSSGSDSDFSDDADDELSIAKSVEIDEGLFDYILKLSMKLQPDFIQKMSAGELVEYLNSLNVDSVVDTKPLFENIISQMKLGDDITDEQKTKFVNSLSKITDYFIDKGLEAKKFVNTALD